MGRVLRWVALGAVLALLVPTTAFAGHSWNGFHWLLTSSSRTLTVQENVSSAYTPDAVRADWTSRASPYLSFALVAGKANITAQEGSYGNTGWIGLAQVWTKGGHISRAVVKLNTWYDQWYPWLTDPDKKQSVYCMEFGHILGLDHTSGDTCMNDEAWYPTSNAHDGEQLAVATTGYGHTHSSGGGRGGREHGPFTIHVYPAPGFPLR